MPYRLELRQGEEVLYSHVFDTLEAMLSFKANVQELEESLYQVNLVMESDTTKNPEHLARGMNLMAHWLVKVYAFIVIWGADHVPPGLHTVVHHMEDVVGRPHTVF